MYPRLRSQRGAYLIIVSFLMVVLVGIGALALDLGRLFVLRSEMQNAADAAAMAAAAELTRAAGAQARAESAARNVLEYDSKFAQVTDLLGTNISLDFFCAIGSQFDPDDPSDHCEGAELPPDANGRVRWAAANDIESHYVRVNLNPTDSSDAYSISLLFLPVLSIFGNNVQSETFLQASAVAGRNFLYCEYPPVMMCNPFEPAAFYSSINEGEQITLNRQGGEAWTPGNFAYLAFAEGSGAADAAAYLADEGALGCTPPIITTEPGQMTGSTSAAVNTRFDYYEEPNPFNHPSAANDWPPAPNVINYPQDQTFRAGRPRFGNGDWDSMGYWQDYHQWQGGAHVSPPPGLPNLSRWEVYNYELDFGLLPVRDPALTPSCTSGPLPGRPRASTCDGIPDPGHLYVGPYPPPSSDAERRVMNVAVVNCVAHDINGRKTFPLFGQEGFAKLFFFREADRPPNVSLYAEYMGWANELDANTHVDVQLYE